MNEEFREIISDMIGYPVDISFKQIFEEDGIKYSDVIAMMQCKRLDRIAEALESINENLDAINSFLSDVSVSLNSIDRNLGGCISVNGKSQFLCITGNVSTY